MNKSEFIKLFEKTYNQTKAEFLKILENNLQQEKLTFVVTANPEAFMLAKKDQDYFKILNDSLTTIVPDGIGLVKGGKMLGFDFKERIPGVELASELLAYANKYQKSIYLFGSKAEVINEMTKLIKNKYPNAILIGAENGYVEDKEAVFQDIIKKKPDIVLVALGMPLQEELIYKHLSHFPKGILMGVGGSFDVLSGMKKRAPKLFIKLNLEWLYRIVKEPKRFKRFYDNNIKFILKLKKERKYEKK